jgi:hypothetical protein
MPIHWTGLSYLLRGHERQRAAFRALQALDIFAVLHEYHPLLAGTVPLDADVEDSDLDIICEARDLGEFERRI